MRKREIEIKSERQKESEKYIETERDKTRKPTTKKSLIMKRKS